jgi:D-alanyl-lipoteichoic acid acyltransferase DltB (MBOAT superfamily)
MLFNSYLFVFVFLPVLLTGYYMIAYLERKPSKAAVLMKLWLTGMSLWFYASFGLQFLSLFLGSCGYEYLIFFLMQKADRRNAKSLRSALFAAGIIGNLALLLYFKYAGFFGDILSMVTGADFSFGNVLLPLAISFYTFQQISFLADAWKGEIRECSLIDYAVYITFFPKILQGPIVRFDEMKTQFDHMPAMRLKSESFYRALLLFTMGLAKKVLLADTLGKAADYGYTNLTTLTQPDAVIVAVSYALQLYFDFSGYCDMAQGVCRMMGLELPLNFNMPYQARNIMDFWKRWHITLTRFFTRYVYIPLGGSREGTFRLYRNIFLIFLLSGFWHGAGWTFIIWGLMHGILYMVTRMLQRKNVKPLPGRAGHVAGVLLTDLYVTAAWIFFRAESAADALQMYRNILQKPVLQITPDLADCFHLDEIWYVLKVTPVAQWKYSGDICMWTVLAVAAGLSLFGKRADRAAGDCSMKCRWAFLAGILFVWSVLTFSNVSTFLYLNF